MSKGIIFGILLVVVLAGGFAALLSCKTQKTTGIYRSDDEGIFSYKVGRFEVYMLVEAQREGNTGILVGADESLLQRYIPETGFMHSTNAFLIKTPDRNVLVDTAFGGPVFEKMKKLGVEPEQVDAVLITHLHGDHFGGLQKDGAALLPNAKIYLAAAEKKYFTETQVNEGAAAALAPYGDNVITFEPAGIDSTLKEIIPGISPIANFGHTPGHTVYLVEDGKDKLIIAGDFLHIALVQFSVPEISASYDMNKEAAAASRRQILDYAARNKIPLGGMHIVYPGIGYVEVEGKGFRFLPAN